MARKPQRKRKSRRNRPRLGQRGKPLTAQAYYMRALVNQMKNPGNKNADDGCC